MKDSSIINAFKHMKLPLMIVGSDGTIVHCNSGTDRLFGYGHGELIGRPAFDVLPVSSVKELNSFIKAPAADAHIKNMVGRQQSGNSVRLTIHLTAWTEAKSGLQHALVLRDITDEIEVDRSLNEKLELANRAIASAGIGVFQYSIQPFLANGSADWRVSMGLDEDDEMDTLKTWYDRVHPDDKEEMVAKIVACTEDISKSGCVYEFRLRSKCGSTWNWRRTDLAVTKRDEEGRAISFMGATVDITEQKEAARILRLNAEQFKSIFENSPIAPFLTTPQIRFSGLS
jgi:PAS domain S-box-containing protein